MTEALLEIYAISLRFWSDERFGEEISAVQGLTMFSARRGRVYGACEEVDET